MKKDVTVSIKFMPAVNDDAVHSTVHKAIKIIDKWGLVYEVGPSCTTVQGELSDILDKINSFCSEMEKETGRFALFLDIDYCKDGISIQDKIEKYR
jgi:uncharacterized protein YqgV (UPF0045/DUF77 family)